MSGDKLKPTANRPTLGTLASAFLASLVTWGWSAIPDTVPAEVRTTGYALALALVAIAVGQAVQHLGKRAPWAFETHEASVALAATLDPEHHREEIEELLAYAGIDSLDEARRIIGAA